MVRPPLGLRRDAAARRSTGSATNGEPATPRTYPPGAGSPSGRRGGGTMAPERRDEINSLGLKSIVSGTLTTCLMGAIVGVLS